MFGLIISLLAGFFRLSITPIKIGAGSPLNMEQDGALIPNGAILAAFGNVQINGSPNFGNWTQTLIPANLTATTYSGAAIPCGIIRRFSPGAAFTDCTDTATNIINAIPGATVNQTFPFIVANLGSGLETLGAGTGITISGTAAIGSATARLFLGQITGSAAITITSCFGWNLGTGGTSATGL